MITQITIIPTEGGYEWLAYNHSEIVIAKSPLIYPTIHEANQGAMTLKGECIYGAAVTIVDMTNENQVQRNNMEARNQLGRLTNRLFRPTKTKKVDDEPLEGWGDR